MRQPDLFRLPHKPWNAGRLIGPKAPLKPKHIWAIRQQLKTNDEVRDFAMFNCALDAKLRGCDLVKLRISDVAMGGSIRLRSTVMQQKTGRPCAVRTSTCRSFATISSGACLFLGIQQSSKWPKAIHQGGPLLRGQTNPNPF